MRLVILFAIACGSERAPAQPEPGSARAVVDAGAAPIDAAPRGRHVTQLAWIDDRMCALTSDHELRCWGNRAATPIAVETPAPLTRIGFDHGFDAAGNLWRMQGTWDKAVPNVRAFVESSHYTVTVFADGKIEVTGDKQNLPATALGDYGWKRKAPVIGIADAVEVISTRYILGMKYVHHSCARVKSGAVSCWFEDLEPQVVRDLVATQIVATGGEHICALDPKHEVRCWTRHGQTRPPRLVTISGLAGARTIFGGGTSELESEQGRVCAVLDDGGVACAELASYMLADPKVGPAVRIADLPPASFVLVGYGIACAALRDDGGVMCWGRNEQGQLGDGTLTDRKNPVRVKYLLDDKLPPAENGHGKEQQSAIEMDWSDLPASCPHPTEVFGVPVVSAYARLIDEGTLRLHLADYRLEPKRPDLFARGAQQHVEISLRRRDPKTFASRPLDLQPYTHGGNEREVFVRRSTGTKLALRADKLLVAGDRFQIAVRDATWVCGTLHADQGKTAIPIAARLTE